MRVAAAAAIWAFAVVATSVADAAAPTLDHIHPSGGQRGTTVNVTADGKFDPWPVKAWTDSAELRFEPAATKGTFSVHIGESVSPGPHLVRLYNGEGASALRVFVVGEQPESVEAEPNDEIPKAQGIERLPLTVNGRLEKPGDVDAFAVRLEAGQCLVASLQGRRLGAPMDPMLHLFDEAGNQVAFAHDGFGLDPLLVHRAVAGGRFVIRVSGFAHPPAADVRLTGGKGNLYRLHLTTGPFARWASPAAIKRGERRSIHLSGWNLTPDGQPARWEADATALNAGQERLPLPLGPNDIPLHLDVVNDGAELAEAQADQASVLDAPFGITGRIGTAREEDRYRFAAKKGERFVLGLRGGWVVSHFDPVLRVEDASGKSLARNDDSGERAGNARLEFSAPHDGTYHAVVSDLNGQGEDDFDYHLSVRKPVPAITAVVAVHELRVAPGSTVALKLNVTRLHGHAADLVAIATALPPGITSSSATVPPKGGEVELTLTAAPDAKPASGPIRLVVLGTDPQSPSVRVAEYDLSKEAGEGVIESTESVWLTVLPPPTTRPAAAG